MEFILAAEASSSKGGVNVRTPFVMRACCFLRHAVADFCELLCSLSFFNDYVWVQKCCEMDFATFDGILCLDNKYCMLNNRYLVLVLLPHLFTVILAAYP